MDRYKALLDDYYGVDKPSSGGNVTPLNGRGGAQVGIDSESFSAEAYLEHLLTNRSFVEVLQTDEDLVQEIRNLDSDMQLLVYDNYSKFIGATDTIRTMKHKVDEIEVELQSLKAQMDRIGVAAITVNDAFSSQRSKIEKLVRLQGLVSNLNFLFELPLRLRKCIENKQFDKCIGYFHTATPILDKYSSVASFSAISIESTQIIEDLKADLLRQLKAVTDLNANPNLQESPASANPIPDDPERFMHLVRILRKLLPERDFSLDFLSFQKRLLERNLRMSMRSELQLNEFVEQTFHAGIGSLAEVCRFYTSMFLEEESADELQRTRLETRLAEFAKPIVHDYFLGVRQRFVSGEDTRQEESYAERLEALNVGLGLLGSVDAPAEIIRPGSLVDRGLEVVELVTRQRVVTMFEELKAFVVEEVGVTRKEVLAEAFELKRVQEVAKRLSEEIMNGSTRTAMELEEVLASGSQMLSELSSIFTNLVEFQKQSFSRWLCRLFVAMYDADSKDPKLVVHMKEEASVADNQPLTENLDGVTASSTAHDAYFVLCLAFVARQLDSMTKDAESALPHVKEFAEACNACTLGVVDLLASRHVKVFISGFKGKEVSFLESAPPSAVSDYVESFVRDVVKELQSLCNACGDRRAALSVIQQVSEASQFRYNSLQKRHAVAKEAVSGGGLTMDIERMFESRIRLLSEVELHAKAIFAEVLKVVLKAAFESARMQDYSSQGFQQMEVDLAYVELSLNIIAEDIVGTQLKTHFGQILKAVRIHYLQRMLLTNQAPHDHV